MMKNKEGRKRFQGGGGGQGSEKGMANYKIRWVGMRDSEFGGGGYNRRPPGTVKAYYPPPEGRGV